MDDGLPRPVFCHGDKSPPSIRGEVRRTDGYLIIDIFAVGDFDLQ